MLRVIWEFWWSPNSIIHYWKAITCHVHGKPWTDSPGKKKIQDFTHRKATYLAEGFFIASQQWCRNLWKHNLQIHSITNLFTELPYKGLRQELWWHGHLRSEILVNPGTNLFSHLVQLTVIFFIPWTSWNFYCLAACVIENEIKIQNLLSLLLLHFCSETASVSSQKQLNILS